MNIIEYLLVCVSEEGSEVSQAACKAARFGISDAHPDRDMLPNNEYLVREVNDLLGVLELLQEYGAPIQGIGDRDAIEAKKVRVKKFMVYSQERGALANPSTIAV